MKLHVIDGTWVMYRCFHGYSQKGASISTAAIYGFYMYMKNLLTDDTQYVVVVFDMPGTCFRHELYKPYKANRKPKPPEMVHQEELIRHMLSAMGVTVVNVVGVEGDDLLGSIAASAAGQGAKVVIHTGDKDLAQVVTEDITLHNHFNRVRSNVTIEDVESLYGVTPDKIPDVLALAGDASDNIPGIPKVGMVTAAKLINQYGGLSAFIDAMLFSDNKYSEAVAQLADQLRLNLILTTIRTDLGISGHWSTFMVQPLNGVLLDTVLINAGLSSLAQYGDWSGTTQQPDYHDY